MVSTPGLIWGKWGELAYNRRATGGGASFREQKKTRVNRSVCGVTVASS